MVLHSGAQETSIWRFSTPFGPGGHRAGGGEEREGGGESNAP